MKKIPLLCFLLFATAIFASPAIAQENHTKDSIYLKNGTVISGIIIGRVPKESVTIQTEDGNLFTIKIENIGNPPASRSYAEDPLYASAPRYTTNRTRRATAGYYGDINLGYGLNNPNAKAQTDFFDVQVINGYQFAYYFGIGAGFGVKKDRQGVSVPIFTNFRWEFLKGAITPFASLNLGYNIRISSIHFGFYAEPKLGVAFSISERSKITIGVSYTWNDAIWSQRYGDNTFTGGGSNGGYSGGYDQFYTELLGALRFSVGIKF